MQFTSWVDAVIFVFSLENETSFNAIYNYYAKMSQYRNMQDIPLILVGTQGILKLIKKSKRNLLIPLINRCHQWKPTSHGWWFASQKIGQWFEKVRLLRDLRYLWSQCRKGLSRCLPKIDNLKEFKTNDAKSLQGKQCLHDNPTRIRYGLTLGQHG